VNQTSTDDARILRDFSAATDHDEECAAWNDAPDFLGVTEEKCDCWKRTLANIADRIEAREDALARIGGLVGHDDWLYDERERKLRDDVRAELAKVPTPLTDGRASGGDQ